MRQIIHSYKLRLTNLSQSNRSLKLSRISKTRDIDLKDLSFLENESAEEILQKIIAGKDVRLINHLDPRHESTNLADRRLNRIYRSVRTLFEETGTYDLFLGYPFVEGKFLDESVARCPVLLFPVRLIRNLQSRPRWKLEVVEDEPVIFNKTFFLAYEQFQQVRLRPEFWEEEIEPAKDWLEWVNSLYHKIKEYEIEVNFNSDLFNLKLERFPDFLAESFNRFKVGNLMFQPQAVLGIFPQSDSSLLQDYQVIEQQPEVFNMQTWFEPEGSPALQNQDPPKYIREENRYFVTEVDESQESALLKVKQGNSLVVHGPPGTGKSQVIVNIIADAMAHGKKVLVVSQKRAALDVVQKRLESLGLGRFSVLVHDYRHDRSAIYRKIHRQIEDIPEFEREMRDLNLTKWDHDYKVVSREADQLTRDFDQLYEALTRTMDCGMSVHELYLRQDEKEKPFPLREAAVRLDQTRLHQLLEKLGALLDYAEFFDDEYPWSQRLSFRHYTYEDKDRIAGKVTQIFSALEELHRLYSGLDPSLGKDVLNPSVNQDNIDGFNQINALLYTPQIREDVEAIHRDELEHAFIKKKFEQIGGILEGMAEMTCLKGFPWRLYSDLKKHVDTYKRLNGKVLRFLSVDFLRARWFLKKWLESKGFQLEEDTFERVKTEFKLFSRLHWHYVRFHEKGFYSDFPLLDDLKEKEEWLHRKENHYKAYRRIEKQSFFPKLSPRFKYGKLDEDHWQSARQKVVSLEKFNRRLKDAEYDWKGFLHPSQIAKLVGAVPAPEKIKNWCDQLAGRFSQDFSELKSLDGLLAQLTTTEQQVLDILIPEITAGTEEAEFLKRVENSVFYFWIEDAERKTPLLSEVSNRSWPRKTKDYIKKLNERQKKVAELVRRRMVENILGIIEYNRLNNPVTYRTIHHQVKKKRRLWSVRKLVSEKWHSGLNQLMPCWMASPESVSAIFPMEKDFFDIVVFDEASQCFVERAIPVMLRGKQSVIAGDDKQLQPLDLYKVRYEESEEAFVENEVALEVESVLDLARTTFEESRLIWHYRSQEEELINFSNHAFYEGKLQVIPPAVHNDLNWPPLEWVEVEGEWKNNRNLPEARRVVRLIMELIQRPDDPSIGIVTFNFFQQELIRDLLDEKLEELATSDEALYEKLTAAMQKTEQEEFMGLFVKNIENVQGDERDIIVFSIGYARNEKGKLITNFGLLNQKGGENRLNVAITRARLKSYIVCSFLPGELQVDHAQNEGPRFLKSYLLYARSVSDGRESDAVNILNRQNESDLLKEPENPIADYLAQRLAESGHQVIRNFGDTSYKLDIVIRDRHQSDRFLLGIECEGSHYFSGSSSKEREVYRRQLMESRGWNLHRVWARNFWADREKEVEKIVKLLS